MGKKSVKILVTGAAGFIGSNLVDHLLESGVQREDLRLFVLNNESLDNLSDRSLDIVKGNIRNIKDVSKAMVDVDVVYHLAAITGGDEISKFDVNWRGTKNLLNACDRKKFKKFVLFSSVAVFGLPAFIGDKRGINESTVKEPVGPYALSKEKAEKLVMQSGVPYAIIRPTTVYGPRDKAGVYQLFRAIKSGLFFRIGNGENEVDYVYVHDLVRAARLAELASKNGDYIIGLGKPIKFKTMIDLVSKNVGRNVSNIYMPQSVAVTLGSVIDLIKKITHLNIPFSADRVKVMCASYTFDISKAKKELKYSPEYSFEAGAKATAKWLKSNQLI